MEESLLSLFWCGTSPNPSLEISKRQPTQKKHSIMLWWPNLYPSLNQTNIDRTQSKAFDAQSASLSLTFHVGVVPFFLYKKRFFFFILSYLRVVNGRRGNSIDVHPSHLSFSLSFLPRETEKKQDIIVVTR